MHRLWLEILILRSLSYEERRIVAFDVLATPEDVFHNEVGIEGQACITDVAILTSVAPEDDMSNGDWIFVFDLP
jgi:hypothetical protein